MIKRFITLVIVGCMTLAPMSVFAETYNHVQSITQGKKGEVYMTEIVIDNEYRDLYEGEYFTINLKNAEFDLDKNKNPRVRSGYLEFDRSSKNSVSAMVKGSGANSDRITFTFHSKLTGGDAMIEIDGDGSAVSSGEYLYATTDKSSSLTKGKLEKIYPLFFDNRLEMPNIVIKEQQEGVFRTLQSDNDRNEALIKLKLVSKGYQIANKGGYEDIEIEVHDGKDNSRRYKLWKNDELTLDNNAQALIFKKEDRDIFGDGKIHKIEIKNLEIIQTGSAKDNSDIEVEFSGILLEKQKVTLGTQNVGEEVKLKTSKQNIKPGAKQSIKFELDEALPNTLFSKDYITLGIYGGAKINKVSDLKFRLKDGDNTFTEADSKTLKLELDPEGDRVIIKNYNRRDTKTPLKLEGTLDITVSEDVTGDIEFFVSEPAIADVLTEIVLEGLEEPTEQEKPVEPEEEPVEPIKPVLLPIEFKEASSTYNLDGVEYPIDAKAYVSKHNRIMVPVRYLSYTLGAGDDDISWDGYAGLITIKSTSGIITVDTKKKEVARGGIITSLSDIEIVGGRTFVPVGEIGKALDMRVYWDGVNRTARFN